MYLRNTQSLHMRSSYPSNSHAMQFLIKDFLEQVTVAEIMKKALAIVSFFHEAKKTMLNPPRQATRSAYSIAILNHYLLGNTARDYQTFVETPPSLESMAHSR